MKARGPEPWLDSPPPRQHTPRMARSGSVRRWLGIGLLCYLGAVACTRAAPPLATVYQVRLSPAGITHHPWLGLSPSEMERKGMEGLRGVEGIQVRKGEREPEDWLASLEVSHVRTLPQAPRDDGAVAEVGVLFTLTRDGARLRAEGLGEASFPPHDADLRGQAFRLALDRAIARGAELLVLQLGAAAKSEEELIADLSSDSPDVRDLAIRVLTERKSSAAVEHLVERLADPDRNIQLRTVGALVEIGDPAAVPALVDATSQRDPAFVIQVAYALGELGGVDAEAFLFTVSTGHPEPAVRRAAAESLEKVRALAQLHETASKTK